MDYSEYRKKEIEISKKLNEWFRAFCSSSFSYEKIGELYSSKEVHLNGVQFVAGFESGATLDEAWEDFIEIPIIIELIMVWAYKTNQIVDRKKMTWATDEGLVENIMDHDLILSCIFSLLAKVQPALEDKFLVIHRYITLFLMELPVGFYIEKYHLNINHSAMNDILKSWEENYLARNISFNLLYDFAPMLGYYTASGNNVVPAYENAIKRGMRFSHVGQVINDLSDCILQAESFEKSYQDQFSDIRNGIITYPVFKLLSFDLTVDALKDKNLSTKEEWQEMFLEKLKNEKVIQQVRKIAKESHQAHVDFWTKTLQEESDFLNRTYGLLLDNKYFKELHE